MPCDGQRTLGCLTITGMGRTCNAEEARETIELYFTTYPRSPSAVCRPRMFFQNNVWVALLGRSIEEGIVGFGSTAEAALAAFDVQYQGALRPGAARHNGAWISDAL
jgi:hypothetical protein